jgi:hypothetical protein
MDASAWWSSLKMTFRRTPFSLTQGTDSEEVSYRDMVDRTGSKKKGDIARFATVRDRPREMIYDTSGSIHAAGLFAATTTLVSLTEIWIVGTVFVNTE